MLIIITIVCTTLISSAYSLSPLIFFGVLFNFLSNKVKPNNRLIADDSDDTDVDDIDDTPYLTMQLYFFTHGKPNRYQHLCEQMFLYAASPGSTPRSSVSGAKSKVGSLENAKHAPGGGKVSITASNIFITHFDSC